MAAISKSNESKSGAALTKNGAPRKRAPGAGRKSGTAETKPRAPKGTAGAELSAAAMSDIERRTKAQADAAENKAAREKLMLDEALGNVVQKADVLADRVRRVRVVRRALQHLGRDLSPQLAGLGVNDIRDAIDLAVGDIIATFAGEAGKP